MVFAVGEPLGHDGGLFEAEVGGSRGGGRVWIAGRGAYAWFFWWGGVVGGSDGVAWM